MTIDKKAQTTTSLLLLLESYYPDSSRRTLRNWIQWGHVKINGTVCKKPGDIVEEGSHITLNDKRNEPKRADGVLILYDDADIVIINKPTGLLSVPLDTPGSRSVLNILRDYYDTDTLYAAHRIDKETSGVLVFAKNDAARQGLFELFVNHDLIREYQAIVEGHLKEDQGTWECYLLENETSYSVHPTRDKEKGKIAITHYEVIRRTKKNTLLRLRLETGRKHQIRVHCQLAGHPVLGDRRYGSETDPYKRMCLHAHRIAFKHPITKKMVDVSAPVPKFWKLVN